MILTIYLSHQCFSFFAKDGQPVTLRTYVALGLLFVALQNPSGHYCTKWVVWLSGSLKT